MHSSRFSAVVSPSRGGAVVEYTIFEDGINYADVLTRRWEAYHDAALAEAARAAKEASHSAASASHASHGDSSGVASIHDLERAMTLVERPPVDLDDRALFVDRVLGADVTAARHALASYKPLKSWARVAMAFEVIQEKDAVEIVCTGDGLTKRIRFAEDASITVSWSWDPTAFDPAARFTSECSFFRPLEIEAVASPDQVGRPRRDCREIREGTRPDSSGRVGHSPLERIRWKRKTRCASDSVTFAEPVVLAISRAMRSLRAGSAGGTRKGSAP